MDYDAATPTSSPGKIRTCTSDLNGVAHCRCATEDQFSAWMGRESNPSSQPVHRPPSRLSDRLRDPYLMRLGNHPAPGLTARQRPAQRRATTMVSLRGFPPSARGLAQSML